MARGLDARWTCMCAASMTQLVFARAAAHRIQMRRGAEYLRGGGGGGRGGRGLMDGLREHSVPELSASPLQGHLDCPRRGATLSRRGSAGSRGVGVALTLRPGIRRPIWPWVIEASTS